MGEYAKYAGEEIKIGTCETMYYLRADQAHKVTPLRGSVDPVRDAEHLLFRFPFPWEDHRTPGDFEPFVTFGVYGVEVPKGVGHDRTQFVSSRGFNVMLPCPEMIENTPELTIHRNGYSGPVRVAYQRIWNGMLVTVAECGGCGALYRYPTLADVEPLVAALRAEEETRRRAGEDDRAQTLATIADRIVAGYTDAPAWIKATESLNA